MARMMHHGFHKPAATQQEARRLTMKKPEMPFFWKMISCLVIAGLLLLGLIGLILPIIPGILFLFLALLLLTRVSGRAAAWAENHHWFNRQSRLWQRAGTLSATDRLRLVLLVGARSAIQCMQSLVALVSRNLSWKKNPR
jgi:uncharacterized membrane protein YbaN (DUF454 family)